MGRLELITDSNLEAGRRVLSDHLVKELTRESTLESGIFCIASQATPWEIATRIVKRLRPADCLYAPWDVLTSKEKVNRAAHDIRWRFAHNNRFDSLIDYVSHRSGDWWNEVKEGTFVEREKWGEDVPYMSRKTFSFWQLCLGGTRLIALDVHVMRGLQKLGVSIPNGYVTPQSRTKGTQKVRKTPNAKEYLRIEEDARALFAQDERFLLANGDVNLALADSVLWWQGAHRGDLDQLYLRGGDRSQTMPYANPPYA